MKRLLSIFLLIITFIPYQVLALNDTWYYMVTAYYSPLPGQEFYLTWDYESEKVLNWEWIAWASWKWVFSGMLAAPKTYAFWTKIYLEWLWVWEVSDRWWAIVTAGNRWYQNDRIDVWVWYGDEWLKRALYWWKRKVKWYRVSSDTKVTLDYSIISSPDWATNWLQSNLWVFSSNLWVGSDNSKVKKLQELFLELWLYNWEIDWIYNSKIIDIVYEFQVSNNIVKTSYDLWAGYWWKQTRDKFKKAYLNGEFDKEETLINNQESEFVENELNNIFSKSVESKDEIIALQEILIKLWYYSWELTWVYDDIIDSVYNFQLNNSIVNSTYDLWAWYFWPKTRSKMEELYSLYLENEKLLEQKRLEVEARKKELEEKYNNILKTAETDAKEKLNSIWEVSFWDVSVNVRNLQLLLKELGYFDAKDTAIYWEVTKKAVFDFQVANNLVMIESDLWAWIFWPKTKEVMYNLLLENIKNELIVIEWLENFEI